jgi:hypothetical protein
MQRGFLVDGDVVEIRVRAPEGHYYTVLKRLYRVIDDEVSAYPEHMDLPKVLPWMKDISTHALDDVINVLIGLTPLFPTKQLTITYYVK